MPGCAAGAWLIGSSAAATCKTVIAVGVLCGVGWGGVGGYICMVVQRHGVGGVWWGGVYLHGGAKAWGGWGAVG